MAHPVRVRTSTGWQDLALVGPPGPGSADYIHTQSVTSATWVVTHNLGRRPAVTVVDTGDSVIIPNVHYDSDNALTITFTAATTGKAYLT